MYSQPMYESIKVKQKQELYENKRNETKERDDNRPK